MTANNPDDRDPFLDAEQWSTHLQDIRFCTKLSGITHRKHQANSLLLSLYPGNLHQSFKTSTWTHVYTDGSSGAATRNGGCGIFIRHPDELSTSSSLPVESLSSKYWEVLTALRETVKVISIKAHHTSHVVFLTDTRSVIQSLQPPIEQLKQDTHHLLSSLSLSLHVQHMKVCVVDPCTLRLVSWRGSRETREVWQPSGVVADSSSMLARACGWKPLPVHQAAVQ